MNTKQRIEELERRVRDLEARPIYVIPQYVPPPWQPAPMPVYPTMPQAPWQPPFYWQTSKNIDVTCGVTIYNGAQS